VESKTIGEVSKTIKERVTVIDLPTLFFKPPPILYQIYISNLSLRCGGGCLSSWCRDFRILQFHTSLTLKDWATIREVSCLVGLVGQLALGVGLGERSAVFNHLKETSLFNDAS
jgi:hypothetical protein